MRVGFYIAAVVLHMSNDVVVDYYCFNRKTLFLHFFFICICSESETQTKREKGTSVPKPSTYIAGLRGWGVLPPQKVDLTLPVDTHNNITS